MFCLPRTKLSSRTCPNNSCEYCMIKRYIFGIKRYHSRNIINWNIDCYFPRMLPKCSFALQLPSFLYRATHLLLKGIPFSSLWGIEIQLHTITIALTSFSFFFFLILACLYHLLSLNVPKRTLHFGNLIPFYCRWTITRHAV